MGEDKEKALFAIPYIVFEAAQAREERNFRRIVIALIVAIALLFISNIAWLYAWSQYDYGYEYSEDYGVTVESDGGSANYADNGGSIINGIESNGYEKNDSQKNEN